MTDDFGTLEQRLKREIASGLRTPKQSEIIAALLAKLSAAGISQVSLSRQPIRASSVKRGIITASELQLIASFLEAVPLRTGLSAMDMLLARAIIDRDAFDTARDFTSCWCAYIGRPWPKGWSAERHSPDFNGGISESALRRMKIRYWNCLSGMDGNDKTIYPLVRDVVIYGKLTGFVEDILAEDVVRHDGILISRARSQVSPSLRNRLGKLVTGLEIIAAVAKSDYTREAEIVLAALAARSRDAP